jgi:hypothetical protein
MENISGENIFLLSYLVVMIILIIIAQVKSIKRTKVQKNRLRELLNKDRLTVSESVELYLMED